MKSYRFTYIFEETYQNSALISNVLQQQFIILNSNSTVTTVNNQFLKIEAVILKA